MTDTSTQTIKPIVYDEDNGLAMLKAFCQLYDLPFDKIPKQKHGQALHLFAMLYMLPASIKGSERKQADTEFMDTFNQYFPLSEMDTSAMAAIRDGLNLSGWGVEAGTIRGGIMTVRAEMIVYRSKWFNLTNINETNIDDLIQGYRWRRLVTGVFEYAGRLIKLGSVSALPGVALVDSIKTGSVKSGIAKASTRALSGGSAVIEAATKGRGLLATSARGGVIGVGAGFVLMDIYSRIKNEEDDIRDAIALHALNDEDYAVYLDDLNDPSDVISNIIIETWWE